MNMYCHYNYKYNTNESLDIANYHCYRYCYYSLQKLNRTWSDVQGKLPKNIFNFAIKYLSNSLPTRQYLCKWNFSKTSDCSFCLLPETLLRVLAGCKVYRFTWRRVLNFLPTSLKAINRSSLYADIPGFHSPSIITGDKLRPNLLLKTNDNSLYVLELTVGFETNLASNSTRKKNKYAPLLSELKNQFKSVHFVNLFSSALGIFSNSCTSFLQMCNYLYIEPQHRRFLISKHSTIAIHTTYYMFCYRNKTWTNPDLLPY